MAAESFKDSSEIFSLPIQRVATELFAERV